MVSRLLKIDDEVVFYSPTIVTRQATLWADLLEGKKLGYDIDGNVMTKLDAAKAFCEICQREIGTSIVDRIHANILLYSKIVALVRSELITLPLEAGSLVLQKLTPVVVLLSTGMFTSAISTLSTMARDEFLTDERIAKYILLLESSNAV